MARPKKAEPDKLDHRLPVIRCNGGDLAMLRDKAVRAGLSRGEFLRRCLRGTKIVVRQAKTDAALIWEIKRIGVNLYQALTAFRHAGLPEPEELASAIAKVDKILELAYEDMTDGSARR
jgi:hypothetical protein